MASGLLPFSTSPEVLSKVQLSASCQINGVVLCLLQLVGLARRQAGLQLAETLPQAFYLSALLTCSDVLSKVQLLASCQTKRCVGVSQCQASSAGTDMTFFMLYWTKLNVCVPAAVGGSSTLSSWLATSKTATGSRGRKRARAEEEDTPPRPSLDDLEQEDRQRQQGPFVSFAQPRQNTSQQPQGSLQQPQEEPTSRMQQLRGEKSEPSDSLQQPQGSLQQPQGSAQQGTSPVSAAQGSQEESAQQQRTPGKQRKGQSSITSFLTATPDTGKAPKAPETEDQPASKDLSGAQQQANLHDAATGQSVQVCLASNVLPVNAN